MKDNQDGWIKLWRKIQDSDMYLKLNSKQRDVLMQCLLLANHKEKEWEWKGKLYKCQQGQFITSLPKLQKKCAKDVSIRNIRTSLLKLETWGFLADESTGTGRLITIVNWVKYQSEEKKLTDKLTDKRQTTDRLLTSNKKIKNVKKNKNKDIYIVIFNFWNSQKITQHKKMSDKIKRKINGILKDGYNESEIKQSIENYSKILKDSKYYWTHKWTLIDFLQRGFEKFKDWDIAQENYLDKENNNRLTEEDVKSFFGEEAI